MELRHLRYFVTVAEFGSFTRAAQALSIAQPPLSNQIRDLENEIGEALLVRHARGVSLTATGETILKEAREIIARADRLKRGAARDDDSSCAVLRIGFITSASHFLLPSVLPTLRARHPEIAVEAHELRSLEQLTALQLGTLDAAICRPPVNAKSLQIAARLDDPFCLAVPPGHKLSAQGDIELRQAASADFVSFKRDQARAFFDQTLRFCNEAGFSPIIRCEVGTVFGLLHLVAAGVGVAIVPVSCVSAAGPQTAMRRLVAPARPGALALVHRRGDKTPATALLVSLMTEAFEKLEAIMAAKLRGDPIVPLSPPYSNTI